MFKLTITLTTFICLLSINAKEYEKKEPRYFLAMKLFKVSGPPAGAKIDLYEKPENGTKVLTLKNEGNFVRNEYMNRFYDQKEPFEVMLVASTEKKGLFYKVFYKNRYMWVNKEDAIHTYSINDYFRYMGPFGVRGDDYKWAFHKIEGKNKKITEILPIESLYTKEEIEQSGLKELERSGRVEEVRIVKSRAWVKVNYCLTLAISNLECRGDFSFWFRPYDDNGKVTNWDYAYKETSFEF
jgi:hypothetical protein